MNRIRLMVLLLALAVAAPIAASAEEAVTEALLDALEENGQITAEQHGELSQLLEEQSAQEESSSNEPAGWEIYWNDGVRLDSPTKDIRIRFGGRLQQDWALVDGDSDLEPILGDRSTGTELRRARLYVSGTLYERFRFKAQYDFADGEVAMKDLYVEAGDVPYLGSLRVGHFKEPFSLEQLTSSKYATFQERSLPDVFSPSRNAGVMLHDSALDSRITWALGGFRETDNLGTGFGSDSEYNVTARLTGVPYLQESRLVHVGVSYTHKFRGDDNVRFRQRPEAHLAARLVDTGTLVSDGIDVINPELAVVLGRWSVQAEYFHAFVDASGADPDFGGLYAQGSVFLTGEHRSYDPGKGIFGKVKPRRNLDLKGGPGAWELAFRYSRLDLDDAAVDGGTLYDLTAGLNWYLNPNLRATLNYVRAHLDGEGDANIVESRIQVAF